MLRSRCPALSLDESAVRGGQLELLCGATDNATTKYGAHWHRESCKPPIQGHPCRDHRRGPATRLSECRTPTLLLRDRVPERHDRELPRAGSVAIGLEVGTTYRKIEPLQRTLDPQTTASPTNRRPRWATSPAIPCFRKEPPGLLSPGRNILRIQITTAHEGVKGRVKIPWAVGHTVGIMLRSHCLALPADESAGYGRSAIFIAVLRIKQRPERDVPWRQEAYKSLIQGHPSETLASNSRWADETQNAVRSANAHAVST